MNTDRQTKREKCQAPLEHFRASAGDVVHLSGAVRNTYVRRDNTIRGKGR